MAAVTMILSAASYEPLFLLEEHLSFTLTHYVPVLPSYRNQSIDLLCKSIDWFLYEGSTGI